jgi:hypothetical protein
MPPLGGRTPPELRSKTTIVVLGMHRSGTSAVAGTLAQLGVELGPVAERSRFNPRGNREIRELTRLHEAILERNGGSWWAPPNGVELRPEDYSSRDVILRSIPGEQIGVKDPRMLIALELWRDLDLRPIGVIRNPVSVRESLERRARERGKRHPQLSAAAWEELWLTYNRALLAELERSPFPVIDFDRHDDLDAQIGAALAFHGLEPSGESHFFEQELVGRRADDWRSGVRSSEAVELWDAVAERAAS